MHPSAILPLASRAADLVGSVIDSSTSLLASQTHDIVRFAMGAPAAGGDPDAHPGRDRRRRDRCRRRPTRSTTPPPRATPPSAPALVEELARHERRDHPGAAHDHLGRHAGARPRLQAVRRPRRPGRRRVADLHQRQRDRAVLPGRAPRGPGRRRRHAGRRRWRTSSHRAGRTPKVIYAIPTFQNPSGATLSLERRHRLLELARSWGSVVIDDDPYGMLRFEGEPVPTLHELAEGDPLVFSVRTFSKISHRACASGGSTPTPELQPLLINAKQAMDTCTNLPMQRLLARFLERRPPRRAPRDAAGGVPQAQAGDAAGAGGRTSPAGPAGPTRRAGSSSGSPSSPPSTRRPSSRVALAEGVAFIPGNAFSPSKRFPDALRICFATTPPERIAVGVEPPRPRRRPARHHLMTPR